jgi:cytochrome c556
MKSVILMVLGLVIGAFGAVTALSALQRGTPLSKGMMSVMDHHLAALREMPPDGTCRAAEIQPHLRMLRALSDDMDDAFLPSGGDDALFERRIDDFAARADAAIASAPSDCAALSTVTAQIGDSCKGCHRDFRG